MICAVIAGTVEDHRHIPVNLLHTALCIAVRAVPDRVIIVALADVKALAAAAALIRIDRHSSEYSSAYVLNSAEKGKHLVFSQFEIPDHDQSSVAAVLL